MKVKIGLSWCWCVACQTYSHVHQHSSAHIFTNTFTRMYTQPGLCVQIRPRTWARVESDVEQTRCHSKESSHVSLTILQGHSHTEFKSLRTPPHHQIVRTEEAGTSSRNRNKSSCLRYSPLNDRDLDDWEPSSTLCVCRTSKALSFPRSLCLFFGHLDIELSDTISRFTILHRPWFLSCYWMFGYCPV